MDRAWAAIVVAVASPLFSRIAAAAPLEATVFPVSSLRISSPFGARVHPLRGKKHIHSGVDFSAPVGAKVRAVKGGKVVFASYFGGYGQLITIDHGAGVSSLYGHLSKVTVAVGEDVVAGEVLGKVGKSGQTTGAHLHFEIRTHGVAVDPERVWGD